MYQTPRSGFSMGIQCMGHGVEVSGRLLQLVMLFPCVGGFFRSVACEASRGTLDRASACKGVASIPTR